MLRIAIVDDSREMLSIAKEIVCRKAAKVYRNRECEVCTFVNPETLLYELEESQYFDIFLLDIEMPRMNGIELAKMIRRISGDTFIIFLTSHAEFAIEGYEKDIKAYRYVLKSSMNEKLPEVMEELMDHCVRQEKNYYYIANQHRVERLKCEDIIYIKKDGKNCILYDSRGGHVDRNTIEKVKNYLEPFGFIGIDRGRVVNIEHIDKIAKNEVYMDDGTSLEISRANIMRVKRSVAEYWGQRI